MGIKSQGYFGDARLLLTTKILNEQLQKNCQVFVQRVIECMTECLTCVNTGSLPVVTLESSAPICAIAHRARQRSSAAVKHLLT